MTVSDLREDLNNLKECDFIRHSHENSTVNFLVVGPEEEHEEEHEHEEEDDCCGLNGRKFSITFYGVENYSLLGEEGDLYTLNDLKVSDSYLEIDLESHNFIEDDTSLNLSFSFKRYEVEDLGAIESCPI